MKNDHVNPSGDTKSGFGNVPFARDEYVAGPDRLPHRPRSSPNPRLRSGSKGAEAADPSRDIPGRKLLDGDLRLRTACYLEPLDRNNLAATRPAGFSLPFLTELESAVKAAIAECKGLMVHTTVTFEDELKKAKDKKKSKANDADDSDNEEDNESDDN